MRKLLRRIQQYFIGSYQELKLVVWPTRQQVIRDTILVVVFSIAVAIFLGILDISFNFGLERILLL
ncbi:MAG: preprotein translocase subunit SecE [bacterium]|nr:preprotein translocase subunit SecE [bacterium]